MRNKLILVASFAFLSAAALGWLIASRRLQQAQMATADAQRVKISSSESEPRAIAPPRRPASPPNRPTSPPNAAQHPKPGFDPKRAIAAKPELRELYRQAYRANLKRRFGPFYEAMRLTDDQIQRFESIATADADAELEDGTTGARLQSDPAIAAILGPAGEEKLRAYIRAEPIRDVLPQTAGEFALTATPITAGQTYALGQLLAQFSKGYQSGGKADLFSVDWDQVLPTAQKILTPEQFEVFRITEISNGGGQQLAKIFYEQEHAAQSDQLVAGKP